MRFGYISLVAVLVAVCAVASATEIRFKRGNESGLPVNLKYGEPAVTKDSGRVFIGMSTGKIELQRQDGFASYTGQRAIKAINAGTLKTTPADSDVFGYLSGLWQKLTWANIKSALQAGFDGRYATTVQGTKADAAHPQLAFNAYSAQQAAKRAAGLSHFNSYSANRQAEILARETSAHAAATYAPLADAHLTGIPTAPTAAPGTATGQIATTAGVQRDYSSAKKLAGTALQVIDVTKAPDSAVGNGIADDTTALQSAINATPSGGILYSPPGKTYLITTGLDRQSPIKINFSNSVIKSSSQIVELRLGDTAYDWYSGLTLSVTANSTQFTIPSGVTLTVGETIQIYGGPSYGSGYTYGLMANVQEVSGGVARLDVVSPVSFSGSGYFIAVWQDMRGTEVKDLVLDNTGVPQVTSGQAIAGALRINATDFKIDNVIARGSVYASYGISVQGIGGKITNSQSSGYIGIPYAGGSNLGGGRPSGYALTVVGANIEITNNTLSNSKHCLSVNGSNQFSSNILVQNNTLSQDGNHLGIFVAPDAGGYYQHTLDVHNGAYNIHVQNNIIISGASTSAISVRNGEMFFSKNKLSMVNSDAYQYGLFSSFDRQIYNLPLTDNTFTAVSASTPLYWDGGTNNYAAGAIKVSNNAWSNVTWAGGTPINTVVDASAYETGWAGDTTHSASKDALKTKIDAVIATIPSTYTLPTADASTLGGVKIGSRLAMTSGVLSADVQGSALTIKEVDGSPTGSPSVLKVSNGSLTDNGDGSFTLNTSGTGSVSTVSVVSANGLAGTVANATSTPAITLSTSVTGLLKGNGTGISAATAGTDYLTPSGDGSLLALPNQLTTAAVAITPSSTSSANATTVTRAQPDFASALAYSVMEVGGTYIAAAPIGSSELRTLSVVPQYSGAGTLPTMTGGYFTPRNAGSGSINNLTGFLSWLRNTSTGTVSQMAGFDLKTPTNAAGGTVTTSIGGFIENQGMTGTTNSYGIYVADQTSSTNPYSIMTGAGVVSFGGNLGIGTTAPGSQIDVAKLNANAQYTATVANDGTGGVPTFLGRASGGSLTSPSATLAGKQLFFLGGSGYGSTGWISAASAAIQMNSEEASAFTDTAKGANIRFATTPVGSATRAEHFRIWADGGGDYFTGTVPSSSPRAGNWRVGGDMVESVQTAVSDANLTVTGAYSKLTCTSTTSRTVTLPAALPLGMVTKTVEVCGSGAVATIGTWTTVGAAGSISWGDAGAPTFASGKCQYVNFISTNASDTTTAAWRGMLAGGTF